MVQPRLGDYKHVEVVGGNGVLYLNKCSSILKQAYTEVCDLISGTCTEDSGVILQAIPPWVKL